MGVQRRHLLQVAGRHLQVGIGGVLVYGSAGWVAGIIATDSEQICHRIKGQSVGKSVGDLYVNLTQDHCDGLIRDHLGEEVVAQASS